MKGIRRWSQGHQLVPRLIVLLLLFNGCLPAFAENMYINRVAAYADTVRVREEVRDECKPDVLLPSLMREEILNRTSIASVILAEDLSGKKDGFVMELSILDMQTPPAASWTTEMRVLKVKSVLYRDGRVAGEYIRNSKLQGGGSWFKKLFKNRNSCQIVERLAREVSEQTVERFKLIKLLPEPTPK